MVIAKIFLAIEWGIYLRLGTEHMLVSACVTSEPSDQSRRLCRRPLKMCRSGKSQAGKTSLKRYEKGESGNEA
jgi:hypothetical protein